MNKPSHQATDVERDLHKVTDTDAEHFRPVSEAEGKRVDQALGLELVSVRVKTEIADDLRVLAKAADLVPQAYIRKVLTDHALANAARIQELRGTVVER